MLDYLVVAPPAGDLPFVFPLGLPDLVRRLGRPTRGFYAEEVPAALVEQVGVAVVPLHWYYSLAPAAALCRRLKTINPQLKIVTGGYTASAFANEVLERVAVDFLIRGDAEEPFVQLMTALLDGGDPHAVPNVSWPGGSTPLSYQADSQTLADFDNRDISWFPSFARIVAATQRLREPSFLYPWVVVSRGCVFDCPECFASPAAQRVLTGRAMILRPAEAVAAELRHWSGSPEVRHVHFNSDFFSTAPTGWGDRILEDRYDLATYYEWYRPPQTPDVEKLLRSFRDVVFGVFYRPDGRCAHPESAAPDDSAAALASFAESCRGRARILLYVTPSLAVGKPDYVRTTRRIRHAGPVQLRTFEEAPLPPIASMTPADRRETADALFAASEAAIPRLMRQHRLLAFVFLRLPILYSALSRLSGFRTGLRLAWNAWGRRSAKR